MVAREACQTARPTWSRSSRRLGAFLGPANVGTPGPTVGGIRGPTGPESVFRASFSSFSKGDI